ncbi:pathogenicity locus [Candidatus Roizmanbacteria bacterium]|nr:pathogenicity locus [Candidatus Roizmanbacteria bacterium]
MKHLVLKELMIIPGVGKSLAQDLYDQGIRSIDDLINRDPEQMYEKQCELQGGHVDRCVLYVFRCAVYFASHKTHDPEKLKWWNWKD